MTSELLSLKVAEARTLNPLIRQFRLVAPDRAVLPGFTAGSHLRVQVSLPDGKTDWRHYSLINFSTVAGALEAPQEYVIAVRLEDGGRGGSRFMHERVQVGDMLTIEAPKNEFPLRTLDTRAVLIAGGIGITPITSMAAQRKAEGRPVTLYYAGRSRSVLAFVPELQQLLGNDMKLHVDDEAGGPLDIDAILDNCTPQDQIYVCGPKVMLDTVLARTQARGWTHEHVHFELFTTPVVAAGDKPIEVVLAQSGRTLTVPANQTILDCLIEHGCDPLFDCKRGECGVCSAAVIEGEVDHRDYFLSDAEKASNKVVQICVSRARGSKLVLDL
jgi:vanillate O-demethylase ferredoxin subunit